MCTCIHILNSSNKCYDTDACMHIADNLKEYLNTKPHIQRCLNSHVETNMRIEITANEIAYHTL